MLSARRTMSSLPDYAGSIPDATWDTPELAPSIGSSREGARSFANPPLGSKISLQEPLDGWRGRACGRDQKTELVARADSTVSIGGGGSPVIHTEQLTWRFDELAAVELISWATPEEKVLGLPGPYGAAKNTMMWMLSGRISKTGGTTVGRGSGLRTRPMHVDSPSCGLEEGSITV